MALSHVFPVTVFLWFCLEQFLSGTFISFSGRPGHRVTNSFKTYNNVTDIQCVYICNQLQETTCKAVNYNNALKTCELTNDLVTSSSDLLLEPDWNVFYKVGICEDGWIKFGQRCYFMNVNDLSWNQAEAYCLSVGSTLVIVDDGTENAFLHDKCTGKVFRIYYDQPEKTEYGHDYYWIGARYYTEYNGYRWVDGTVISFNGWGEGNPDVSGCVDMLGPWNWLWNDHSDCVATYGASICEKSVSE